MALRRAAIAFLFTVLSVPIAFAQTAADFYRGKSVDLYINGSVGGGYDLYGRMVARHIGKHIPGNPTMVVDNMPGGSEPACSELRLQSSQTGRSYDR